MRDRLRNYYQLIFAAHSASDRNRIVMLVLQLTTKEYQSMVSILYDLQLKCQS